MEEVSHKEKQEFQDLIEFLENVRGRHTELVSVLIPADYNANAVVKQLEAEKSTASNIKSRTTRNNVIEALEKIIRELKLGPHKYEKGLALYCGNISRVEGQTEIEFYAIHPIETLNTRTYRCDQVFVTEPLKEMLEAKEIFGLLVIERKEATIGVLEGNKIITLEKMTSGIPGKVRAGGQSAQRFHRITEGLAKAFFRRIAEVMKEKFFDMKNLKGILVGGPIPTKEEFLEEGQLVTALKSKVIAVKDIGYADEHGLRLLVEASRDDLSELEIMKEKKILENFFNTLGKFPKKAPYKEEDVKKALEIGAVNKLIISKKYDRDKARELVKTAEQMGSEIIYVSDETDEGRQFFNLEGIGAILRFII